MKVFYNPRSSPQSPQSKTSFEFPLWWCWLSPKNLIKNTQHKCQGLIFVFHSLRLILVFQKTPTITVIFSHNPLFWYYEMRFSIIEPHPIALNTKTLVFSCCIYLRFYFVSCHKCFHHKTTSLGSGLINYKSWKYVSEAIVNWIY